MSLHRYQCIWSGVHWSPEQNCTSKASIKHFMEVKIAQSDQIQPNSFLTIDLLMLESIGKPGHCCIKL